MVRKLKPSEPADEMALIDAVRTSAHLIWQAGLGAFSRAQEEGDDLFSRLVKQGADLQKKTRHLASEKGLDVSDTVSKLAGNVGRQAAGSWDKIEKVFEDRVSRSLRSLGVPTHHDIKLISRQLDELKAAIEGLAGAKPAAVKTTAKTTAKTAAKTAAKKSAPAKRAATAAQSVPAKAPAKRSTIKGAVRAQGRKPTRTNATQV